MSRVSGHSHPVSHSKKSLFLYCGPWEKKVFGPTGFFGCNTPSGHWGKIAAILLVRFPGLITSII